ncbi:MAG TPA: hypothetical protein PKC38_11745, partial [Chitinophagales bacterium]|nr:hypothetical protein [Chitinophagales bacterium]
LLLGAFLPVAIWMNANLAIWGDLTGSAAKIRQLGWTALPVYEWFDHPLFSVSGFSEFLTGNLKTFWRGELIWWKSPIAMSLADWVFIITTLIFLPWGLISSGKTRDKMQVQVSLISGLGFILLLLLMGFLSIQFDYGVCENPSRAHPYFVSGRLISGAMIPFAILYLQGLYHAVRWIKSEQAGLWTIAALFFFYIASEAIIHIPVFESSYNFFHYITNRQF